MDQSSCIAKLQAAAITETLNTLRGLPAKVNEKQMAGWATERVSSQQVHTDESYSHVITQAHHHNTGGKTISEVYSSFKQANQIWTYKKFLFNLISSKQKLMIKEILFL